MGKTQYFLASSQFKCYSKWYI